MLPNPCTLIWSHATNSLEKLHKALESPMITAIEGDILMGHSEINSGNCCFLEPIMSHPPHISSDLTTKRFLQLVSCHDSSGDRRLFKKHIKLDFKDIDSVYLTLKEILDLRMECVGDTMIYLNADILAGPGINDRDVVVPADTFMETCLSSIAKNNKDHRKVAFAFSLGFKVDVVNLYGYTKKHLDHMSSLIAKYNLLNKSSGVVLAVNARLLAKNLSVFDHFLDQHPTAQVLAWTGATEPPIAPRKINYMKRHFQNQGTIDQVGFDCQIAHSNAQGALFDVAIAVLGVWKVFKHWLFRS